MFRAPEFTTMTDAETIARAILERHANAWSALEPTQHVRRERVLQDAVATIAPMIAEIVRRVEIDRAENLK